MAAAASAATTASATTAAVNTESAPQTEIFMTHDWGVDEKGRKNHDRVSIINQRLRDLGYRTWFDEDYIHTDIQNSMVDGINNTRLVLVHLTTRYMDKVNGTDLADNCRQEFLYSFRLRKKILCITMDPTMSKTSNWTDVLMMTLGGCLFVRFDGDLDNEEYLNKQMEQLVKQLNLKGIKPLPLIKYCVQCETQAEGTNFCHVCGNKLEDIRAENHGESKVVAVEKTEGPKRDTNTKPKPKPRPRPRPRPRPETVQQMLDTLEITCKVGDDFKEEMQVPERVTNTSTTSDPKPETVQQAIDTLEITCKANDDPKEEIQVPERDDDKNSNTELVQALPELVEKNYESRGIDYIEDLLKEGDVSTLESIIDAKKKCVALRRSNGFTPLILAAHYGQLEVMKYLLENGASPDDVTNKGDTILHLSSYKGHVATTRYIIEQYKSMLQRKRNAGHTPLHSAAEGGCEEIITTMISHGADVDARSDLGFTPLLTAAQWGKLGALKCLVNHGASAIVVTNDSATALFMAAKLDRVDVVEHMLAHHAALLERATNWKWTPLHGAAHKGSLESVRLLLKAGANVYALTKKNETPVDLAKRENKQSCVTELTEWMSKKK